MKFALLSALCSTSIWMFATEVSANLHCDALVNPSGIYSASFTFGNAEGHLLEPVGVFLCDHSFNCDMVFSAPAEARGSMRWEGDDNLIISFDQGKVLEPGQRGSSGRGRPNVRIQLRPLERVLSPVSQRGTVLTFDRTACRLEPILRVVAKPAGDRDEP